MKPLTILEVLEALIDAISMWASVSRVLSEDLAAIDLLPLKVVTEHINMLSTASAWGSKEENASHYANIHVINLAESHLP